MKNIKKALLGSMILSMMVLASCDREKDINPLTGTWVFEYEILEDGTKEYNTPYALVDFTYSDGFILKANGTGSTIWYDSPNGDIEWSSTRTKLIIHDQYWDGELTDYKYSIKEVKSSSLIFENYKGHKYFMKKE